jgi:hypothetical protein
MDEAEFEAIKAEIDHTIDLSPNPHVGVTMGFGLTGEFLIRNLLTVVYVNIGGLNWDMRTYRDRFVYPDPAIGDHQFFMGRGGG